LYTAGLNDWHR